LLVVVVIAQTLLYVANHKLEGGEEVWLEGGGRLLEVAPSLIEGCVEGSSEMHPVRCVMASGGSVIG
jgi:hypothetical protein